MKANDIMGDIHRELAIPRVQEWFRAAASEIQGAVVALARTDGIDVAVREVRRLYVAWLVAGQT